jgi:CRISPR system Cascade subunit CasD
VPEHVLFQLYAPLVSWGTPAVGTERPSATRPTKSATFGLLGAALGLRRREAGTQRRLAKAYGFGVRVDRPGSGLPDRRGAQRIPARFLDDATG